MKKRILFVDDEPMLLQAMQETGRSSAFLHSELETFAIESCLEWP